MTSVVSNTYGKQDGQQSQQMAGNTYYQHGNRGGHSHSAGQQQQQGQFNRNNGMQQGVRFANQTMGTPYGTMQVAGGGVPQVGAMNMPAVVAYDPYTMTYAVTQQQGGEMAAQGPQQGVTMVTIDSLTGQMGQMNIAQRATGISAEGVPVGTMTMSPAGAVDPNTGAAYGMAGMAMPIPPNGGDAGMTRNVMQPPMVGHGYPQMYVAQQAGMVPGMFDPSMMAAQQGAMMFPGQQQGGFNNYQQQQHQQRYGNGRMDSTGGRRAALAGGQHGGRGMGGQGYGGYAGRQQGMGGGDGSGYANAQPMSYMRNTHRGGGHGNAGNHYGAEHHNANSESKDFHGSAQQARTTTEVSTAASEAAEPST
jgi:hypothetical protein